MLTAFQEDGGLDLAGADALVDFYLEGGSHGLFAVCQSSEMFFLDDDERLHADYWPGVSSNMSRGASPSSPPRPSAVPWRRRPLS